jgi:bifunctional non-homologous end joining protein LigD
MIQAELLTETTELHFQRMLLSAVYGFQEKHNGHRLVICKENGTLRYFNREGVPSSKPLPTRVKYALLSHPLTGFVIDGELVGGTFYIFDALILGDEIVANDSYEYREARYHAEFDGYNAQIVPVETARTPEAKRRLWDAVLASHGEGIVSKNMTVKYTQGRAGAHWKLKFLKECDVIVMGPSPEGKDSVEIGVYDEHGQLHRVSGCSLRGKFRVTVGDVLTVRYLYASRDNHIVQPVLMRKRTDKAAITCDIYQLVKNKNFIMSK